MSLPKYSEIKNLKKKVKILQQWMRNKLYDHAEILLYLHIKYKTYIKSTIKTHGGSQIVDYLK